MMFELRTINKGKVYDSIVDQILEGIRKGAFPLGGVLPTERALASKLGVSRGSVREALRILEHSGVVDVRTGSGTYVTEAALTRATSLRAHAALVGEESPLDVMIARRAVEPVCAEYAALNRHRRDLETLSATIVEHQAQMEADKDPAEIDLAFHVALAVASRNPVMEILFQRIAEFMRQGTWQELKHRSRERPGNQQLYLKQHGDILEALEIRDAAKAGHAMRIHLDTVEEGLLAEIDE
jgi:GntR family transcriptional regulator, transcriptional repressor for pyruvate dehydrogenase complex